MAIVKKLTWKSMSFVDTKNSYPSDLGYAGKKQVAQIVYNGESVTLKYYSDRLKKFCSDGEVRDFNFSSADAAKDFAAIMHAFVSGKITTVD